MRRTFLLLMLSAIAMAGCSTPYKSPVFAAKDGGATTFNGIADILEKDKVLDVLFVHGMCTHDGDWAKEAVQNVYSALGGNGGAVNLVPVAVDGTGIVLFQQTLDSGRGKMRANAILWSPLTTPLKAQLCYDQTNKSASCPPAEAAKTYPYQRATLNRILKDTILDDCLSDAMIYQGRARDDINMQMQQAVLQAVATSGGAAKVASNAAVAAAVPQSVPLVVVTESLGSKVAFDALFKLSTKAETSTAGARTWDRITQIFMGANQLPILALADKKLDGTFAFRSDSSGYPEDPISALMSARRGTMKLLDGQTQKLPQVVAFTDPNDLLSFILSPSPHAAAAGYPVVDVIVSNDKTYLGVAELPTTAHLGYRTNEAVRSLIACGNPKSAACK